MHAQTGTIGKTIGQVGSRQLRSGPGQGAFAGRALLLAGIASLWASPALAVTCPVPNPSPAPPTAAITRTVAGVTIGTANPVTVIADGVLGCDGREGGGGGDGNPAQQGGAAGVVSYTLTDVTVTGASLINGQGLAFGTVASGRGGAGGVGGFGDAGISETVGGAGGNGGAAASVTLTFSGSIDMRSVAQPAIGIDVLAIGGSGGSGAGTANTGIAGTFGSAGGNGAPGAPASATVSGDIIADAAGVFVDSSGGAGGPGGDINGGPDLLRQINSGPGGNGANAGTATVTYQSGTLTGRTAGIVAVANGGRGGDSGRTFAPNGLTAAAVTQDAGAGANGATASATLAAGATIDVSVSGLTPPALFPYGGAVAAISVGGDGGNGQDAGGGSLNATSGSGGNGGVGGTASATILGTISFDGFSDDGVAAAIDVYSGGGKGGSGGNSSALSGTSGGGGLAGSAGPATLVIGSTDAAATVRTVVTTASAALVQSIGGGGGSGGTGRGLNVDGGSGSAGGNGGTASAQVVNGRIVADGVGSAGLIVQSVGGGGGFGGDAVNVAIGANLAVGGNGGQGGSASAVNVSVGTNAVIAAIDAFGDEAVLAQSIGGSGGKGGSAFSTGSGFLSMTIGGDGGTGAAAGNSTIGNDGIVTTYGSWGDALKAQSIGGGGGDGGIAISNSFGIVPTAAVAIGGRGGDGGTGATATISNTVNGQVTTYGSNANALVAQSVGGGGGTGGLAVARAVDFTLDPRIPAISISVALGGTGGTGNVGGAASVNNAGFASTSGEQAFAVLAQSIGGGGGIGGDATALSYSGGFTDDAIIPPIAVSVALGASGGSGGAGGTVSTSNSGLILTLGTDAIALVAQSVGGGGGAGGAGDSLAVANDPENENPDDPNSPTPGKTLGVSLSVGGTGGTGGHGGAVTLGNSGRVVTSGDGAEGFYAQSVGGGGGIAGGGTANAGGNTLTVAVGIGASGGAGGDGGTITATNTGAILTRGADATAVYAQSVGGGGGEAGKGASTSGGVDNVAKSTVLFDTIAAGFNVGADVTDVGDGVFKIGAYAEETKGIQEIINILRQPKKTLKSLINSNLDLSLSIGGQGGAAGHGGAVTLSNSSDIQTWGAQSDGIFAQSVGGGGGRGGTTSSTGSSYDDTRNQVALGVSGGGGAAGDGGTVSVTNEAGANIVTRSALAFGIYAQSVGGGGGAGANSQDVNGSLESLSIGFNGRDGAQGKGGAVTVSNLGSISTEGKNGIAIIAQSVGGGGGIVKSMTTDMTFNPDELQDNPQGRLLDIHSFNLTFGGGTNSQGDGGAVTVNNSGSIATNLRNAHGVLAQSVGGGGGITIGGQLIGRREDGITPPPNTNNGNGGKVIVSLTPGTSIATGGDGAYGVFAQSIGGGGGFAGDLSNISTTSPTLTDLVIFAGTGNGGDVTVNMQNTTIETSGSYAAGVLAQSVGGGGGILAQKNELQIGTGGGTGVGGVVTVGLTNATIRSTGANAPAILAYSNAPGGTGGAAIVNIDGTSTVAATSTATQGTSALGAAIAMMSPTLNVVNNRGQISAASMAAIAAPSGALTIANSGQINGSIAAAGKLTITGAGRITGPLSAGEIDITNDGTLTGPITSADDLKLVNKAGATVEGDLNSQSLELTNIGSYAGKIYAEDGILLYNDGTMTAAIGTGINGQIEIAGSGTIFGDIGTNAGIAFDVRISGNTWTPVSVAQLGGTGTITLNQAVLALAYSPSSRNIIIIDGALDASLGTVRLTALDGKLPTLLVNFVYTPGAVEVRNAAELSAGRLPLVLQAQGIPGGTPNPTVTTDSSVISVATELAFGSTAVGYDFIVTSDYSAGQTGLSTTQGNVAAHLDSTFAANDAGLRPMLQTLARTQTAETAVANLSAISGQSLVAATAVRLEASLAQTRALYSCPNLTADTTLVRENSCAWFRVDGNWANRDAEPGYAGYAFDATGLSIGGQKEVREGWFVGGSIGYQDGTLREDGGLVRINSDGIMGALSLKHQSGPLSLGIATSLGNARMNSRRTIPVASATASARFDVLTAAVHGRAAWRFGGPSFYIEPELQLAATYLDAGSYRETGAQGFDLVVDDGSDWVFNILPAVQAGTQFALSGKGRIELFASAGVDLLRSNSLQADARFAAASGPGSFVTSLEADSTAARLGAGIRFANGKGLELRLRYDGRLSAMESWHSANARLAWHF